MKAVNLLQPNASLLAMGAINEIHSTRYTAYRGPVAIYASTNFPVIERMKLRHSPFLQCLLNHFPADEIDAGNLPTGQIVGVGNLEDVVDDVPTNKLLIRPDADLYIWKFTHLRMLGQPISCECERGLADLPDRIAERLEVFV